MFTALDRRKAYDLAQAREGGMRRKGDPENGYGISHGKGDLESGYWTSNGKGDLEKGYRTSPGKSDLMMPRSPGTTVDTRSYSGAGGTFMRPEAMNSGARLNRTDRDLVETGAQLGNRFGMGTPFGIIGASEIGRTAYGEAGGHMKDRRNLEAVVQSILNRLGIAASGKKGFGSSFGRVLSAYDANAYGYNYDRAKPLASNKIGPLGNDAYRSAKFGTRGYDAGLAALKSALKNRARLPASVALSTHYFTGPPPDWAGRHFSQFGPHIFGYDETMPQTFPSAVARTNAAIAAGQIKSPLSAGKIPGLPDDALPIPSRATLLPSMSRRRGNP